MIDKKSKIRFIKKILINNDCFYWNSTLAPNGYGQFWLNGKTTLAHRISYKIFKGKIPKGMFVCHCCDNPPCVKPSHLFLGTQFDNQQDCIRKGRRIMPSGENSPVSKLKNKQVLLIKKLRNKYTQKELSEKFGICQQNVSLILSKKRWQHLSN